MARFLWICLGGAVGTGARYLLSGWLLRFSGSGFPYGTLAVNAIGSFLLCLLMQIGLSTNAIPPTLRVVLATGVMGGFTTYSAFNYETLRFLQEDAWLLGLVNLGVMLVACLMAGYLGFVVGKLLGG